MGVKIPVGEVQNVFRWRSTNDPEEMVITIGTTGPATGLDLQSHAGSFAALMGTQVAAANMMHINWTYVGLTCYQQQDGDAQEVAESNVNVTGTLSLGSVPANCALLVRKRTAQAGARGSGRMYVPPFSLDETAVNNNGVIGNTDLNGLQTRWSNFYNAAQDFLDGESLCLFHSLGGSSGAEVLPSTPITSLSVDSLISTQRRRMRR